MNHMESGEEQNSNFRKIFGVIGSQRRHLCLGILTSFLALGTITAQVQQHCPYFSGYWMGATNFLGAFFMFLCSIKPKKSTFISSALIDCSCLAVILAGVVKVLTYESGITYSVTWIGIIMAVLSLYHCLSCIYDTDAWRKWEILGETDTTTSTTAVDDERRVEEAPANIRNQGERRRRRRTQSPPADFRLPDEMPKLPNYGDLAESEGLPPDYDTLSIAPPQYTPPIVGSTPNDRTHS